jgi:hypothetical protein
VWLGAPRVTYGCARLAGYRARVSGRGLLHQALFDYRSALRRRLSFSDGPFSGYFAIDRRRLRRRFARRGDGGLLQRSWALHGTIGLEEEPGQPGGDEDGEGNTEGRRSGNDESPAPMCASAVERFLPGEQSFEPLRVIPRWLTLVHRALTSDALSGVRRIILQPWGFQKG